MTSFARLKHSKAFPMAQHRSREPLVASTTSDSKYFSFKYSRNDVIFRGERSTCHTVRTPPVTPFDRCHLVSHGLAGRGPQHGATAGTRRTGGGVTEGGAVADPGEDYDLGEEHDLIITMDERYL